MCTAELAWVDTSMSPLLAETSSCTGSLTLSHAAPVTRGGCPAEAHIGDQDARHANHGRPRVHQLCLLEPADALTVSQPVEPSAITLRERGHCGGESMASLASSSK